MKNGDCCFTEKLHAENVKGILGRQWSRMKSCDEMETVTEFTYLDDRVSAGGRCEVAVTATTRCGLIMFTECIKLLYGSRFPLYLKGAVCKSYVRPAILYGRRHDGNFTEDSEIHGERNVKCSSKI